jgi:hypothetical protein
MKLDLNDPRLDHVCKVTLKHLINLKEKVQQKEKKEKLSRNACLLFFIGFITYFFIFAAVPYWPAISQIGYAFISNSKHLFFLLLVISSYAFWNTLRKQIEKAEEDFHALRCEVIQRSEEFWPSATKQQEKKEVLKYMHQKYGINLYHEHE